MAAAEDAIRAASFSAKMGMSSFIFLVSSEGPLGSPRPVSEARRIISIARCEPSARFDPAADPDPKGSFFPAAALGELIEMGLPLVALLAIGASAAWGLEGEAALEDAGCIMGRGR